MIHTLFNFGKQSRIDNINFAFACGSSGSNTVNASKSIWYRQRVNNGSGSSLK